METKNLYVCLVMLKDESGGEPLKVIDAPIATNEEAAKEIAGPRYADNGPGTPRQQY